MVDAAPRVLRVFALGVVGVAFSVYALVRYYTPRPLPHEVAPTEAVRELPAPEVIPLER